MKKLDRKQPDAERAMTTTRKQQNLSNFEKYTVGAFLVRNNSARAAADKVCLNHTVFGRIQKQYLDILERLKKVNL